MIGWNVMSQLIDETGFAGLMDNKNVARDQIRMVP
jgi:hypothetical protein